MENPFINALAKALNIEGEELTNLVKEGDSYKSDAEAVLVDKIEAHIGGVKQTLKAQYDQSKENLQKKAIKETSERFEKALAERFGVQAQEGVDIVEAAFNAADSWRSAEIDADKVRTHPEFIKMVADAEKERTEALEKAGSEWKEKYNTLTNSIQQQKIQSALFSQADDFWNKREVVDTVSPEIRANWLREFKKRVLTSANFQLLEDGRVIPVDEKGEVLKNNLEHPITIEELMTKSFEGYVPTKASKDRSSSGGSGGSGGGSGGSYTGAMPKNREELNRILQDKNLSSQAKNEVIEYCEKKNIL
jgi:ribosomal protein S24E